MNFSICPQVSQWYDLVVFTASMEIYGAAVADKLDNGRNILRRRYYRQHCTPDYGSYTKDLSAICSDLNRVKIKFKLKEDITLKIIFLWILYGPKIEHYDVFIEISYQVDVTIKYLWLELFLDSYLFKL